MQAFHQFELEQVMLVATMISSMTELMLGISNTVTSYVIIIAL